MLTSKVIHRTFKGLKIFYFAQLSWGCRAAARPVQAPQPAVAYNCNEERLCTVKLFRWCNFRHGPSTSFSSRLIASRRRKRMERKLLHTLRTSVPQLHQFFVTKATLITQMLHQLVHA